MVGTGLEPWSNSKVYNLNYHLLPCKMELIIPTHSDVIKIQHYRYSAKGGCCHCGAGGIVGRENHLPFSPEDNQSGGPTVAGLGLKKTFMKSGMLYSSNSVWRGELMC